MIAALRTMRRWLRRNDDGFTLAETAVAMGLFGLLLITLGSITMFSLRVSTNVSNRTTGLEYGTTALAEISKVLRTAVLPDQLANQTCQGCDSSSIISATPTSIKFYANLNNTGNGPTLVTFYLAQDPLNNYANIMETDQPPTVISPGIYTFCTPGTPGCVVYKHTIGRGLPGTSTPVLAYYDFDGNAITSNPITTTDLPTIDSIDVTIPVKVVPGQGVAANALPVNTLTERITLPNADINVLVDPNN